MCSIEIEYVRWIQRVIGNIIIERKFAQCQRNKMDNGDKIKLHNAHPSQIRLILDRISLFFPNR